MPVSSAIRFIARGSWQASEFLGGNLSDLTFNDYNQACANQAYNDAAVAIEKL